MTHRPLPIPDDVRDLCARFDEAGERAWVVGGCLRDILLGRGISDWDLATTAEPRKVQRLFRRVIPTGIDHGTVTVLHRGGSFEVTTLRGEGAYTDGRRPDEVFFVRNIEEDLARRDFTVNAIAYDPIDDTLTDPFGGLEDLERRLLRAVGDPVARFGEDGLRILRGARFSATLDFSLETATEAAFRPSLPVFAKVSHERVRDEWMKAMSAARPSRAFEVMARTGILGITLPPLAALAERDPSAFAASLEALDACAAGKIPRHAALLHRVGADAAASARIADAFLREYRYSNEERVTVAHLIRSLPLVVDPSDQSDADLRRLMQRVGLGSLDGLLELKRAVSVAGPGAPEWLEPLRGRLERLRDGLVTSPKDLAVTGADLMASLGGGPGPHLGAILSALVDRVTEDPSLNHRDTLLALGAELEPEARAAGSRRRGPR